MSDAAWGWVGPTIFLVVLFVYFGWSDYLAYKERMKKLDEALGGKK